MSDIDFSLEICKRISNWKGFGRCLELQDYHLRVTEAEKISCKERAYELMKRYCDPDPIPTSWEFWKPFLLHFNEGNVIISEIEGEYPQCIEKGSDLHAHAAIASGNGIILHHNKSFEKTIIPGFSKTKQIEVNVGSETAKLIHYQEYDDWLQSKTDYINTYTAFEDINCKDFSKPFSLNRCKVLETIEIFLNEKKDRGFVFKGYSLKNHYSLFGEKFFHEEKSNENIHAYFASDNVLFHIKLCHDVKCLSRILNGFLEEVQLAQSVHEVVHNNPIVHVGVVLVDDDVFYNVNSCSQCIENQLILPKSYFTNVKCFKKWYGNTIVENRIFYQMKDELLHLTELSADDISKKLKENIIAFMALKSYDFPTFTKTPEYQLDEVKKLVLLTGYQMKILFSKNKHILITGGYGSGKSLILEKRLELVLNESCDEDIFLYICHNKTSKFALQMNSLKEKYPKKNILVFTSSQNSQNLSSILSYYLSFWENKHVHFFIDEFCGIDLSLLEINSIKKLFDSISKSHIVICFQSLEYKAKETNDASDCNHCGYQYESLVRETDFEIYHLNHSMRCSVNINKFLQFWIEQLNDKDIYAGWDARDLRLKQSDLIGPNSISFHLSLASKNVHSNYKISSSDGHKIIGSKIEILSLKKSNHVVLWVEDLILGLKYQLDEMKKSNSNNLKKLVICVFHVDQFIDVYKALDDLVDCSWTTNLNEFLKASSCNVLLTDYASICGFEFTAVILLIDLRFKYLTYQLVQCFARAQQNLYIIAHEDHPCLGLLQRLKFFDCVNWKELDIHKIEHNITMKDVELLEPSDYSRYDIYDLADKYAVEAKCDEIYEEAMNVITKNDNVNLFKEVVKLNEEADGETLFSYFSLAIYNNAIKISMWLMDVYKLPTKSTNFVKICHYGLLRSHKIYHLTPLHVAAIFDYDEMAKLWIERGIDVNVEDNEKTTPLHLALKQRSNKVVNVLLNYKANPCYTNINFLTPLHFSVKTNNLPATNKLLSLNVDVNAKDKRKRTPLHYAVKHCSHKLLKLLLEKGADINICNEELKTPLQIALEKENLSIIKILQPYGNDIITGDTIKSILF